MDGDEKISCDWCGFRDVIVRFEWLFRVSSAGRGGWNEFTSIGNVARGAKIVELITFFSRRFCVK